VEVAQTQTDGTHELKRHAAAESEPDDQYRKNSDRSSVLEILIQDFTAGQVESWFLVVFFTLGAFVCCFTYIVAAFFFTLTASLFLAEIAESQ